MLLSAHFAARYFDLPYECVVQLCKAGKIKGAICRNGQWMIPHNTRRPFISPYSPYYNQHYQEDSKVDTDSLSHPKKKALTCPSYIIAQHKYFGLPLFAPVVEYIKNHPELSAQECLTIGNDMGMDLSDFKLDESPAIDGYEAYEGRDTDCDDGTVSDEHEWLKSVKSTEHALEQEYELELQRAHDEQLYEYARQETAYNLIKQGVPLEEVKRLAALATPKSLKDNCRYLSGHVDIDYMAEHLEEVEELLSLFDSFKKRQRAKAKAKALPCPNKSELSGSKQAHGLSAEQEQFISDGHGNGLLDEHEQDQCKVLDDFSEPLFVGLEDSDSSTSAEKHHSPNSSSCGADGYDKADSFDDAEDAEAKALAQGVIVTASEHLKRDPLLGTLSYGSGEPYSYVVISGHGYDKGMAQGFSYGYDSGSVIAHGTDNKAVVYVESNDNPAFFEDQIVIDDEGHLIIDSLEKFNKLPDTEKLRWYHDALKHLGVNEFAKAVGVSSKTVYNWIRLGNISSEKDSEGGHYFFEYKYVEKIKEQIALSRKGLTSDSAKNKRGSGQLVYRDALITDDNLTVVKKLLALDVTSIANITFDDEKQSTLHIIELVLANFAVQLFYQSRKLSFSHNNVLANFFLETSSLNGTSQSAFMMPHSCTLSDRRTQDGMVILHSGDLITKELHREMCQFRRLIEDLLGLPSGEGLNKAQLDFLNNLSESHPLAEAFSLGIKFIKGEDSLSLVHLSLQDIAKRKLAGAFYTPKAVVDTVMAHLAQYYPSLREPLKNKLAQEAQEAQERAAKKAALNKARANGLDPKGTIKTSSEIKVKGVPVTKLELEPIEDHPFFTACDPCCGTGIFLMALQSLGVSEEQLFGQDLDPLSVALCRINLALNSTRVKVDVLRSNISVCNSLMMDSSLGQYHQDEIEQLKRSCLYGRTFDLIVSNPPWGSNFTLDELIRYQKDYQSVGQNVDSCDIFVERFIKLTNKNGLIAMVLPESMLSVASHTKIRQMMRSDCAFKFVTYLDRRAFSEVACPSIILGLSPSDSPRICDCQVLKEGATKQYTVLSDRPLTPDILSFYLTDEEYECLSILQPLTKGIEEKEEPSADNAKARSRGRKGKTKDKKSVIPPDKLDEVAKGANASFLGDDAAKVENNTALDANAADVNHEANADSVTATAAHEGQNKALDAHATHDGQNEAPDAQDAHDTDKAQDVALDQSHDENKSGQENLDALAPASTALLPESEAHESSNSNKSVKGDEAEVQPPLSFEEMLKALPPEIYKLSEHDNDGTFATIKELLESNEQDSNLNFFTNLSPSMLKSLGKIDNLPTTAFEGRVLDPRALGVEDFKALGFHGMQALARLVKASSGNGVELNLEQARIDTQLLQTKLGAALTQDGKLLSFAPDVAMSQGADGTFYQIAFLKNNADFALGIVTGKNGNHLKLIDPDRVEEDKLVAKSKNSKKRLTASEIARAHQAATNTKSPLKLASSSSKDEFEAVYRGNDVFKFGFKEAIYALNIHEGDFQQVAPLERYRAKEKLIYRFISDVPVFAYDDKQLLSLNSANIVIPRIEGLPIKYVLAILNSSVCTYFLVKRYNSLKILRSHLEEIPIPVVPKEQYEPIIELVDKLLNLSSELNNVRIGVCDFKAAERVANREYEEHKDSDDALSYRSKLDEASLAAKQAELDGEVKSVKLKEQLSATYNVLDEMIFKLYHLNDKYIATIKKGIAEKNKFLF